MLPSQIAQQAFVLSEKDSRPLHHVDHREAVGDGSSGGVDDHLNGIDRSADVELDALRADSLGGPTVDRLVHVDDSQVFESRLPFLDSEDFSVFFS